jgi:hypothetical protein
MTRIDHWDSAARQLAARIIEAKGSGDEALYLKLMQRHARMRTALIGFGL